MMTEQVPQLASRTEIYEALHADAFKNIQPIVLELDELNIGWLQLDESQLKDELFGGNEHRTEVFLEVIRLRKDIKIYKSGFSDQYAMDIPSWNGDSRYTMRVVASARHLTAQIETKADEIYIINTRTKRALAISSLLPPFAEDQTRAMVYYRAFDEHDLDNDKEAAQRKNARNFTISQVSGIGSAITVGEIHNQRALSSALHEAGHLWAKFLEIDAQSEQMAATRKTNFTYEEYQRENGEEAGLALAHQIGVSERLANVIGRLLNQKIQETGFFDLEETNIDYDRDESSGASYDARHANLHLPLFDRVRSAFVIRPNRMESGRERMLKQREWILQQIQDFQDFVAGLPDDIQTHVQREGQDIDVWKADLGDSFFNCSVHRDSDGVFVSASAHLRWGNTFIRFDIDKQQTINMLLPQTDDNVALSISVGATEQDFTLKTRVFLLIWEKFQKLAPMFY